MRFSPLLALGAVAVAQETSVVDENSGPIGAASAMAAASAAASVAQEALLPAFTPTSLEAPFLEQFTDDWDKRWKASHAKKENTEEEWQFVGTWEVKEPTVFKGIKGDKGLVLKDRAAHHAISAKFDKPIDNKGKTLVVQYEVKLQMFLECGGAYMKLLKEDAKLASDEFSNASPYIIMFGPDKCGATNKVHFIFRHKNPVSGEYEEKHLDGAPTAEINKLTNLYTLVVQPDQTFEILINNEVTVNGSLLENFTPPVNPEKEIDDAEDKKPETWVDEKEIVDPAATKPEDWDEDAPFEIVDAEATQPEDWLVDEPRTIPDPEATLPEDWDEEEDGAWDPPVIPNPKCDEASGCGPWEAPMIRNPAYKGKWSAPKIDNPAYKGEWAPRKIKNPNWFEDKTPANFEPMGAIGFELWTMNEDILFDNIYIGHSVEDAATLRKNTWDIKRPEEEKAQAAVQEQPDAEKKSPNDLVFMDDPVLFVKEKVSLFIELVQKNPIDAIKFVPEVAAAIGLGIVTLLLVLFGAGAAAAPSADEIKAKAQKAKDAAQKTKDQVAEAITTGAEKAKDEATKRTTRSSGQ